MIFLPLGEDYYTTSETYYLSAEEEYHDAKALLQPKLDELDTVEEKLATY
ncbi:hypothetical protein ACFLY2_02250 [Patescibacteria group bacterium]